MPRLTHGYSSWHTQPPPTNHVLICLPKPTGSRLCFTWACVVHSLCPYTVIQQLHDRQRVTCICDQTQELNLSLLHRKPACQPLDHSVSMSITRLLKIYPLYPTTSAALSLTTVLHTIRKHFNVIKPILKNSQSFSPQITRRTIINCLPCQNWKRF